ncbi:unnamed protein product, partial [Ectocarpus sp. 12 AP-2014]
CWYSATKAPPVESNRGCSKNDLSPLAEKVQVETTRAAGQVLSGVIALNLLFCRRVLVPGQNYVNQHVAFIHELPEGISRFFLEPACTTPDNTREEVPGLQGCVTRYDTRTPRTPSSTERS